MRTDFTADSLRNPDMAQSEKILRSCVHCGFCNATCPTYLITGDENDGPRGRIYLMREMLQSSSAPDPRTVAHIDGCLSCLGCMTTCPSGVDYQRLVDHARAHIEVHYRRPLADRLLRGMLNLILPHSRRFGFVLRLGRLAAPFSRLMPMRLARMTAMAKQTGRTSLRGAQRRGNPESQTKDFAYDSGSPRYARDDKTKAAGKRKTQKWRVALLGGCVQPSLAPETNAAVIRLLNRLGIEVVIPPEVGCCGALSYHLGRTKDAQGFARKAISAWMEAVRGPGLDAIIMSASGCGSQVKDYGHLLRNDPQYAEDAAQVSTLCQDISEFLTGLDLGRPNPMPPLRVAYHAPCSLTHGQRITGKVERLLQQAGFKVLIPREAQVCCGAAGSYLLLQPEMSGDLAARKAENLQALKPDVIVSGNAGCQTQLRSVCATPVLHWAALLDWAYGGKIPESLAGIVAGT